MKTSVKPILRLSLVAAFAFGLTACSNNAEPTPNETSAPSSSSSPTNQPTSTISASPSVSPSATPTIGSVEKELKAAQKAFPDVEGEGNVTKEDVQLAVSGAQRYLNIAYNSGYLANGSWVKNGADSQELVKLYGKDWSDAYRAQLEVLVDDFHNEDSLKKEEAAKQMMLHFFFFDNTKMTLPEDCNENNIGAGSCLVGQQLSSNQEMTYIVNKDNGSIYVDAVFTANVRFIKDGVQGVTPVKYDVQLEMIKNPYPDEDNFRYAYLVNDIGGSWDFDNWHEGE